MMIPRRESGERPFAGRSRPFRRSPHSAFPRAGRCRRLVELLAADVVVYGDGGGNAPSWPRPIVGRERVSALFAGLGQQMAEVGITFELHDVNGQPGALVLDVGGSRTSSRSTSPTARCRRSDP
jgi:hypothetical protein